jgi:hypothetical protein
MTTAEWEAYAARVRTGEDPNHWAFYEVSVRRGGVRFPFEVSSEVVRERAHLMNDLRDRLDILPGVACGFRPARRADTLPVPQARARRGGSHLVDAAGGVAPYSP